MLKNFRCHVVVFLCFKIFFIYIYGKYKFNILISTVLTDINVDVLLLCP